MKIEFEGHSLSQRDAPLRRTRKRLSDERITELLQVAAQVFMAEGFAAASIEEIARRANASKSTFYSRFPTKEDLFLAVIERRMTDIFQQVAKFPKTQELNKTLEQFANNLLTIALSPEQIALIRLINMESGRYPTLAARYYECGPKRAEETLALYISSQIATGLLRDEEPLSMARQLMNLITGSPVRWFVLGFEAHPISKKILQQHIGDTIKMFLRAYRVSHN
jgi:TetR/AcrR family transcriptional repressor of mexJK operon